MTLSVHKELAFFFLTEALNIDKLMLSLYILIYLKFVLGVRTDLLTLQFPINSEDEVVEMYREYFKKQPNVTVAVLGLLVILEIFSADCNRANSRSIETTEIQTGITSFKLYIFIGKERIW